ncbi:hypothetical protein SALBM135S_05724 [Streptomyces alboniger]
MPVNVCGNSVNVIALLNPTFGNVCANDWRSERLSSCVSAGPWSPPAPGRLLHRTEKDH